MSVAGGAVPQTADGWAPDAPSPSGRSKTTRVAASAPDAAPVPAPETEEPAADVSEEEAALGAADLLGNEIEGEYELLELIIGDEICAEYAAKDTRGKSNTITALSDSSFGRRLVLAKALSSRWQK